MMTWRLDVKSGLDKKFIASAPEVFASSITGTILSALSIVYVESSTPDACVASLRALSRPTSVELGSASAAMRRAFGNTPIRSSCRLPSSSVARMLMPVVLPPGLARERTSPAASMSSATPRMGIVRVTCCAAFSATSPEHTIASTGDLTNAAVTGKLAVINRKAALINHEILPFDEAVLPQFVQECQVLWCFTRIGGHECKVICSTQLLSRGGKRRE